jgi:capsular polysaccharide biosynthesis protein
MLRNEVNDQDHSMTFRDITAIGSRMPIPGSDGFQAAGRRIQQKIGTEVAILLAVTAIVWISTAVYLATTTPKYTASVTIGSAALDSQGSTPPSATSLGLSLPISLGTLTKPTDKYIYIISTPGFAKRLMERGDFAKLIFSDRWDGTQWTAPNGLTNDVSMWLKRLFGYPAWAAPDENDVSSYLNNNLVLRPDANTDFVELSFDHRDPKIAAQVLEIITSEGDRYLKEANEDAYQSQVNFITRRIQESGNLEIVTALRSYLMNVVLNKTLIDESTKYAVRVWGTPSVSSLPTKPPVLLAALLGLVLGPILSLAIIFFGRWIRSGR